jgi:hypothetical protein
MVISQNDQKTAINKRVEDKITSDGEKDIHQTQ